MILCVYWWLVKNPRKYVRLFVKKGMKRIAAIYKIAPVVKRLAFTATDQYCGRTRTKVLEDVTRTGKIKKTVVKRIKELHRLWRTNGDIWK